MMLVKEVGLIIIAFPDVVFPDTNDDMVHICDPIGLSDPAYSDKFFDVGVESEALQSHLDQGAYEGTCEGKCVDSCSPDGFCPENCLYLCFPNGFGYYSLLQLTNPALKSDADTDLEAVCGDPTCSSINTVDRGGRYNSLQLNDGGNPVISYVDDTRLALKVAVCGDRTCSADNIINTLDSEDFVSDISLQLNAAGNPVISYNSGIVGENLKVAVCGYRTCSAGNVVNAVDSENELGSGTSLRLNDKGNPVISYSDFTNRALKVAVCGDPTCLAGNVITTLNTGGHVGVQTSLHLNDEGNPVIFYFDALETDLKVAVCNDPTCSGGNVINTVDSEKWVGQDNSLKINNEGNPVIAYSDIFKYDLKVAVCGDPTCSDDNITINTVDSDGCCGASLQLNDEGNPIISYQDLTSNELKVMECGNPTSSAGNIIYVVDSKDVGEVASLQLDDEGNPIVSYREAYSSVLRVAKYCID